MKKFILSSLVSLFIASSSYGVTFHCPVTGGGGKFTIRDKNMNGFSRITYDGYSKVTGSFGSWRGQGRFTSYGPNNSQLVMTFWGHPITCYSNPMADPSAWNCVDSTGGFQMYCTM